jgi:glycine oxidase
VLVRRDHRVDNRRLGAALWAAAAKAGVRFHLGTAAVEIRTDGGATARVTGVRLEDGTSLTTDRVVVAAGAWSGQLRGLPRALPVRPVRGQMFAVRITGVPDPYAPIKPALHRTIMTEDCYIVPREGGTVVVGATVEEVGFAAGPTPRGIAGLLAAAARAVPALADLPLVETWAGFRPGTPDGLPILGADPDVAGLYYATGHYRNGILLTPATALLLADELSGRAPALPLDRFGIERFESVVR